MHAQPQTHGDERSRREQTGDVVVWRASLLPTSETFIVNQMAALQRWRPLLAGMHRVPSLLPVEPDLVLTRSERRALVRLGTAPRLHRLLRAPTTRLLHAHFGDGAAHVATAARWARCPLVVTFHGYDATRDPRTIDAGRYARRLPQLFAQARWLVAVSDFIAERLVERGAPAHKVVVHHIGIPLAAGGPPDPERPPTVLFVGRLVEKKNCAGLLDAVAALPWPLCDTPVRIVGDGSLRADLERQALRLGLDVTFLGAATPAQVADEMRRATVLCSPGQPARNGDAEGLPITPLEAAAHGLPVVAGDSGGTRDAVVDGVTGALVGPGDQQHLVTALSRLLRDPDLARRQGAAGRRHVERHFDVVRQTRLLEDLYDDSARPGPGAVSAAHVAAAGAY